MGTYHDVSVCVGVRNTSVIVKCSIVIVAIVGLGPISWLSVCVQVQQAHELCELQSGVSLCVCGALFPGGTERIKL